MTVAPLLVIEGPDAAGKSTLVDALAADLDGAPFHHSRPRRGADPLEAALHYACVRRAWVLAWPHHTNGGLLILDRSHWSSRVLGRAIGDTLSRREREAMIDLSLMEEQTLPRGLVLLCDAPDAVLDARLAARGTPTTDLDRAVRVEYRHQAGMRGWERIDTTGPLESVVPRVVRYVRDVIFCHGVLQ